MSPSDARCVIRIAIALAALKHKPRDRSTLSYLLDLQTQFPVATRHNDGQEWRTYALELEKQLAALKAQCDADQELLSKFPADLSQAASTSDAPPPKKKSKRNPTKDQHDPEWNWDQNRADWSRYLSSQYPSSPSLIAAYTSLKGALASPNADLVSYASRLTDAILRAFETIHVFLFSPSNSGSEPPSGSVLDAPCRIKPEYINSPRIALTSPFLMYILRTALQVLVRTAQDSTKSKRQRRRLHTTALPSTDVYLYVNKVLDHFLERVLLVLLRAIAPLCSARLAPLLSTSLKMDKSKNKAAQSSVGKGRGKSKSVASVPVDPTKKFDVRTDVFTLIGTSLEALEALPSVISSDGHGGSNVAGAVRDRLGLETIRELEALYSVPLPRPSSACSPPSQQPSTTSPEPPLPPSLPTPTPTTIPPSSVPSQTQSDPHSQPQLQLQSLRQQHPAPELRTKWLERLAGTRAERVQALATRDAGWFLASTLNLCITSAPPIGGQDRTEGPSELLKEALLNRVGKLVRSVPLSGHVAHSSPGKQLNSSAHDDHVHCNVTGSKPTIDAVCQNMLLAICERAMSQLGLP